MSEIGRMTDADGEPLIFETYSDGSCGASDGEAQRFRLGTPEERDEFAQLLNATFLAAEREHPRVFPIYARFAHPDNGYDGDQKQAAKYLTPGDTYLIDHMDVGRSHTEIYLHGIRIGFNSVLFAAGDEAGWVATEERAEAAGYHRPCCDHCNNLAGDPDGHDYGDESAHDGPCGQCADERAREEAIRDAE